MFVRFMFVFDFVFMLFRITWWPSAGKELSPWLATRLLLFYAVSIVSVLFPLGVRDRIVSVRYHCLFIYLISGNRHWHHNLGPVKRICVFEHSVTTNFSCACPAIQRGQGSGFLSEGSSGLTACMSEQRRFWRDCADAQARLNLRCSHRR